MADQIRNKPIHIPIESDDDVQPPPVSDDDVFEIDGDAVDFDADLLLDEEPAAATGPRTDAAAPTAQGDGAGHSPQAEVSREAVYEMMRELRQKAEQIARLNDEKSDLLDKLLRKQAEFENFRKRGEREMQDAYVRARADLVGDLLPVLDNFALALQHADAATAEAIREGVHLINKQLVDTLGRLGLEAIDAVGQQFDPELHEAVMTEQRDDLPDHAIAEVLQRGYKLGDKLLRPARVKVAVQPEEG